MWIMVNILLDPRITKTVVINILPILFLLSLLTLDVLEIYESLCLLIYQFTKFIPCQPHGYGYQEWKCEFFQGASFEIVYSIDGAEYSCCFFILHFRSKWFNKAALGWNPGYDFFLILFILYSIIELIDPIFYFFDLGVLPFTLGILKINEIIHL